MSISYPVTLNQIFNHTLNYPYGGIVDLENNTPWYIYVAFGLSASTSDIQNQNVAVIPPLQRKAIKADLSGLTPSLSIVALNTPFSFQSTINQTQAVLRVSEYAHPEDFFNDPVSFQGLAADYIVVAGGRIIMDQTGVKVVDSLGVPDFAIAGIDSFAWDAGTLDRGDVKIGTGQGANPAYILWDSSAKTLTVQAVINVLPGGTAITITDVRNQRPVGLAGSITSTGAASIAWSGLSLLFADGHTLPIANGSLSGIAALTYLYVVNYEGVGSVNLLAATSFGSFLSDPLIIAIAQNGADKASIQVIVGRTTIAGDWIATGSILAANIHAGTITANEIAANTITAGQIAALTITAAQIAANTITAGKLNVSQLSAISADLGSITAGTVTGATIQTAASGARTVLNTNNLSRFLSGVTVAFDKWIDGDNKVEAGINAFYTGTSPNKQGFYQIIMGDGLAGSGYSGEQIKLATDISGTTFEITDAPGVQNTVIVRLPTASGSIFKVQGLTAGVSTDKLTIDSAGKLLSVADLFGLNKGKGLQAQLQDVTIVQSTGVVNMTTAYQDVTGVTLTFTPAVAETVYVWARCVWNAATGTATMNAGDALNFQITDSVAGAQAWQPTVVNVVAASGTPSAMAFYKINMTAATHTLKMQAKNTSGARGTTRFDCGMLVWRVVQ